MAQRILCWSLGLVSNICSDMICHSKIWIPTIIIHGFWSWNHGYHLWLLGLPSWGLFLKMPLKLRRSLERLIKLIVALHHNTFYPTIELTLWFFVIIISSTTIRTTKMTSSYITKTSSIIGKSMKITKISFSKKIGIVIISFTVVLIISKIVIIFPPLWCILHWVHGKICTRISWIRSFIILLNLSLLCQ